MPIPKRCAEEQVPPAPQEAFTSWIESFPHQFPVVFDPVKIHLNPFIHDQQEYTYQAIFHGLKFLEEIALPWSNTDSFSLGNDANWGYIHVLQCLSSAMEFEARRRRDGGFEVDDKGGEDDKDNVSSED